MMAHYIWEEWPKNKEEKKKHDRTVGQDWVNTTTERFYARPNWKISLTNQKLYPQNGCCRTIGNPAIMWLYKVKSKLKLLNIWFKYKRNNCPLCGTSELRCTQSTHQMVNTTEKIKTNNKNRNRRQSQ